MLSVEGWGWLSGRAGLSRHNGAQGSDSARFRSFEVLSGRSVAKTDECFFQGSWGIVPPPTVSGLLMNLVFMA
jgi:hypothetical protein